MNSSLIEKIEQKFDSLTGVYERFTIENLAKKLLAENYPFVLFLIDGDNFKNVNDGYGHAVGDLVIKTIAENLQTFFQNIGFVGRFGGDEFMVIMPDVVDYDSVWNICHNLHVTFSSLSIPDYPSISITLTLGLSRAPKDGIAYDELFAKADKALYRGKQKGRSCFIIYLNEKHKDIKVLSSDSPIANSMQRHNQIFTFLSESKSLKEAIPAILSFFTTGMMIDHMAVQGQSEMLFSEIYSLSKSRNFSYIDTALISPNIDPSTGIFRINEVQQVPKSVMQDLIKNLEKQQIFSIFFAEISYAGKFYGYLRADATSTLRIWQHCDMNLLLTAAKAIAMVLFFQGKTLEEL